MGRPLLARKRVINVKLEAEKGTYLAGNQPLLVYDLEMNPTADYTERRGTGLYRGNEFTGILGAMSGVCSFKCEMRSAGAAAMEAGLAILLQACGLKKTLEVYQVHRTHTNDETITIDVSEDGVFKSLAGCSGNVTFEAEAGCAMMCNFEFHGRWIAPTDVGLPANAPSDTAVLKWGSGTFTLATTPWQISKFSIDMGNEVVMRPDPAKGGGIGYYMIPDQTPVISIDPEADLIAVHDFNGLWLAGTETAVVAMVSDGTYKATFTMPKVQYIEVKGGERDKILTYDINGQCNHSAGNDSVAIAVAAVAG